MQTREQPTRPWQQIAADIYKSGKDDYMLVVDYYSNMAAVKKLTSFNAKSIIEHLKDIFMLYGLPTVFVSNNGPPFSSREFQEFLRRGYIEWKPSSPYYSKFNGLVERTIQTIKNLINKSQSASIQDSTILQYYANVKWMESSR